MSRKKKGRGINFHTDEYWQNAAYNQRLFFTFRDRMMSIALSRFKWINLPQTCDARFLEQTLLFEGYATIAFPRKQPGTFYSTRMTWSGPPNVYDNPTRWRSIGNRGWNFRVDNRNGVFVYDNMNRHPLMPQIDIWARELVDVMQTKQMNRRHQRIPWILVGSADQYNDMVNLYKQVAGGEPAVLATDGINTIEAKALMTGVPYLGKELQEEFLNVWNQFYATIGVPNLPFKAERQIEDEVNSMTTPAELTMLDPLSCRRFAVDKLNARFSRYLTEPVMVVKNEDNISDNYNFMVNMTEQVKMGAELADLKEANNGAIVAD